MTASGSPNSTGWASATRISTIRPARGAGIGFMVFIASTMKTMNPIPAPKGGRIVEILVSDAQPVEFGEPLAVIE